MMEFSSPEEVQMIISAVRHNESDIIEEYNSKETMEFLVFMAVSVVCFVLFQISIPKVNQR